MFVWPLLPLTFATAVAPGLPWLLMMTAGWCPAKRPVAATIALCQFGVLGINAAQPAGRAEHQLEAVLERPRSADGVQWGPLAMFLIASFSAWPWSSGWSRRLPREGQSRK